MSNKNIIYLTSLKTRKITENHGIWQKLRRLSGCNDIHGFLDLSVSVIV